MAWPLVIERTFATVAEAIEHRKEIENRMFLIEHSELGFFDMGTGWVGNQLSVVRKVTWYHWMAQNVGQAYKVHLLKAETLPEGKLSIVENVMPQSLIRMLEAAPENPTFRAKALATLLVPIPEEVTSWEKIREWVEANVDQTRVPRPHVESEPPPAVVARNNQDRTAIEVDVRSTYTEHGTVRFSQGRSGIGRYHMTYGEVSNMVTEALENGDSTEQLIRRLKSEFEDMCDQEGPDTDGGEMRYGDVVDSETDGHESHAEPNEVRRAVALHLWTHDRPSYLHFFGEEAPH